MLAVKGRVNSCRWPAQVVYGFWRVRVHAAEKQGKLPPGFWQTTWLWRGKEARLLVEPVDIANWSAAPAIPNPAGCWCTPQGMWHPKHPFYTCAGTTRTSMLRGMGPPRAVRPSRGTTWILTTATACPRMVLLCSSCAPVCERVGVHDDASSLACGAPCYVGCCTWHSTPQEEVAAAQACLWRTVAAARGAGSCSRGRSWSMQAATPAA